MLSMMFTRHSRRKSFISTLLVLIAAEPWPHLALAERPQIGAKATVEGVTREITQLLEDPPPPAELEYSGYRKLTKKLEDDIHAAHGKVVHELDQHAHILDQSNLNYTKSLTGLRDAMHYMKHSVKKFRNREREKFRDQVQALHRRIGSGASASPPEIYHKDIPEGFWEHHLAPALEEDVHKKAQDLLRGQDAGPTEHAKDAGQDDGHTGQDDGLSESSSPEPAQTPASPEAEEAEEESDWRPESPEAEEEQEEEWD